MTLPATPEATCTVCTKPYLRLNSMQRVCGRMRCLKQVGPRKRKAELKEAKAKLSKRKEDAKRRKDVLKEAWHAFSKWIRLRDYGENCICCDSPMDWNSTKPGGAIDAGHYLSVGSAKHMQFVEANVHAQRKSCNRPGGTTRMQFRAGMIGRIGLAAVEALEADQSLRKYTADELRAIRDDYRARVRAIRARNDD